MFNIIDDTILILNMFTVSNLKNLFHKIDSKKKWIKFRKMLFGF